MSSTGISVRGEPKVMSVSSFWELIWSGGLTSGGRTPGDITIPESAPGSKIKMIQWWVYEQEVSKKDRMPKNRIKRKGGWGEGRKESLNGNKGRSEWNERKHGKRWEKSERKWKKVDNKNMGILFTTYRLMVVFVLLLAWRRIRMDFWSPAPTHTSAGVEHHNNSILVCI